MISSRIEAFDMKAVLADSLATGEGRSKALADFAREKLREAQDINRQSLGRVPDHDTYVDGTASDRIDAVKPDGTIVFEFELASDVVEYCVKLVDEHSPVLTGRYRKSHVIFADGVPVGTAKEAIDADEIAIVSTVPYARKIEGDKKRRPQSKRAPKGVYRIVALMAQRRYGNVATVKFEFRNPMGGAGALQDWAAKNASRKSGATRQRAQMTRNTRQPALVIRFR